MRICPGLLCFVNGGMERLLLRGTSAKRWKGVYVDETLRPRLIVFDLDNTVWNRSCINLDVG